MGCRAQWGFDMVMIAPLSPFRALSDGVGLDWGTNTPPLLNSDLSLLVMEVGC